MTPTPPATPSGGGLRFAPGTMLAERYRIVALLGSGGMGEVYRADDTKLGHQVALKFLPANLAADPRRLEALYAEVRIGRQISHPNACRLYDIVEAHGHHFLAMEYVDGEDLASLLRRIGRLPADKALDVARDICAGLAAAHDKGIVHRDLKPANVMIDGRGRARITDFGLAALAVEVAGAEVFAGTPVYMAPEQLSGKEVTVRSDIYALGLILYEMFTGKRLFEAKSVEELLAKHREAKPPSLSSTVRDINPAVERAILRCLDENPAQRPATVYELMAALPGGDPLQAALAAGETPSPAMVAAASTVGDLRPAVAWACLGAAILGLVAVAGLAGRAYLVNRVGLPKPPDALVERAKEVATRLGYTDRPADTWYAFDWNQPYTLWLERNDPSPVRWEKLRSARPGGVLFHYRQSPRNLIPMNGANFVAPDDPPMTLSGMLDFTLDSQGRVVEFSVVPPERDEAKKPLGRSRLGAAVCRVWTRDGQRSSLPDPMWAAPVDTDRKAAWDGTLRRPARSYPSTSRPPAIMAGRSGSGSLDPGSGRCGWSRFEDSAATTIANTAFLTLYIATLVGGALLARRYLRLGKGDRRGAFKAAGPRVRRLHADAAGSERPRPRAGARVRPCREAFWPRGSSWPRWSGLLYLAFEPSVRRHWPYALVSWNRLLVGRWRDPLIGRDTLVGAIAGCGHPFSFMAVQILAPGWFASAPLRPVETDTSQLDSIRNLAVLFLFYSDCGLGGHGRLLFALPRAPHRPEG